MTYYMEQQARELQKQAAALAVIARDYVGFGPGFRLQATTMQRLAQQHYEMARFAQDQVNARSALRRQAQIVGRGKR